MTTVDSEEPALPEPAGDGTEATSTTTAGKPTEPAPAPARKAEGLGPLLARLHFYAGIMVAPFLLVAAVTGLLYTFTPSSTRLSMARNSTSPAPAAAPCRCPIRSPPPEPSTRRAR